jgi:phospholipid transport system substrate-binding protein
MKTFETFEIKLKVFLFLVVMLLAPGQSSAADMSPQDLVQDTSSRMLAALRQEKEAIQKDPARLYELVADIVLPNFDFRRMGQWVLGKYWRSASPEQRERFVRGFRHQLIRTYGIALIQYSDEKINYLPFGAEAEARQVTVRTEIEQKNGLAIPISYSLYSTGEGWKVYDVAIEGVSLVTNYRSTFSRIIEEHGMDALIKQLEARKEEAG